MTRGSSTGWHTNTIPSDASLPEKTVTLTYLEKKGDRVIVQIIISPQDGNARLESLTSPCIILDKAVKIHEFKTLGTDGALDVGQTIGPFTITKLIGSS